MRILIAPVEVAGIAGALKLGFDRIGVAAELALSQPHRFEYRSGESSRLIPRIWLWLGAAAFSGRFGRVRGALVLVAWKAWSICVLAWALFRFDSFIFLFGNTLTNTRFEAWLLAKMRKKVVVVYFGSDSRPPYIDGQIYWDPQQKEPARVRRLAERIASRIALHERHGFTCVNSPFAAQFHERPVVNWFAMGVPRNAGEALAGVRATEGSSRSRPLRVLHSPSNPAIKGTSRILDVVAELQRKGHDLELVLLRQVPNHEVIAEIDRADLIIDQIYSDTPTASFAVEAAIAGKPVLVAGHAASRFHDIVGPAAPPVLFVHPDEVFATAERLVSDPSLRERLGREAQEFVRVQWSPEAVAGRYLRLLEREPPPEWLVDSTAPPYLHGGGMTDAQVRGFVASFIEAFGAGALQLDHKPFLREAFVAFAAAAPREDPRP